MTDPDRPFEGNEYIPDPHENPGCDGSGDGSTPSTFGPE